MLEHQLSNARTIVSYQCDGVEMTGMHESLFTQLGRARDWGGELSADDLENLALVVLDFIPDNQAWADARAEILKAIEDELLREEDLHALGCYAKR